MRIVLDTSVIVEYIVANSPWRGLLTRILSGSLTGYYKVYISTVTLAETFYIAKRIYEVTNAKKPEKAAENLLYFLEKHRGITIVPPDHHIALEAGRIKSRYKVSLADSFVIATAKILKANPLFKKVEKELKPILDELKREYGLIILKDLSENYN